MLYTKFVCCRSRHGRHKKILHLALKISDIPKGVLDQELLCSRKATQTAILWWGVPQGGPKTQYLAETTLIGPWWKGLPKKEKVSSGNLVEILEPSEVGVHTVGENAESDDKIFDSSSVTFLLCEAQAGPQTSVVLQSFIYHVGISNTPSVCIMRPWWKVNEKM